MELIPAIDLRGGHVVRLYQGDFGSETRYDQSPAGLYAAYARAGARRLHVVDLDGARDGQAGNRPLIAELATLGALEIQCGGGLRSALEVRALLATGVRRAVIGSTAVLEPAEVREWLAEFGPDRLVLAFDVRLDAEGVPHVVTHGWREQSGISLWEVMERYAGSGAQHVLCTDVARDGALAGPNLALYRECMSRLPGIQWQASGGIRDAADLAALDDLGLAAAVSGKALLEGRIRMEELKPFLPGA